MTMITYHDRATAGINLDGLRREYLRALIKAAAHMTRDEVEHEMEAMRSAMRQIVDII